MATRTKKSIDEQIAEAEAAAQKYQEKVKALKAKKEGGGKLTKESPGVQELFAAIEKVCEENSCNNIAVVQAINRMKKLGLEIVQKPKAPRGTGSTAKKPKSNSQKSS